MESVKEIERELLLLSPRDREIIALKAWESLLNDPAAVSDPNIDPEGIKIATSRDAELEAGAVSPIDENEFRRLTGGGK